MSDQSHLVICHAHGASHATWVCRHLRFGHSLGFHTAGDDPRDPRPDAWCATCDAHLREEGGWTDRLRDFADLTLICAGCYDEVKERNALAQ
jgi:hypothetical protein